MSIRETDSQNWSPEIKEVKAICRSVFHCGYMINQRFPFVTLTYNLYYATLFSVIPNIGLALKGSPCHEKEMLSCRTTQVLQQIRRLLQNFFCRVSETANLLGFDSKTWE
jgi:hypothetical protein